jgi:hypothetical protein
MLHWLNQVGDIKSDLGVTERMDGRPAKFLRFSGPDQLVIGVNAAERTITRECWRAIPLYENKQDSTPAPTGRWSTSG